MADEREPWAGTALWVRSTTLSPDEIGRRLRRENWQRWRRRHQPARTTWIANFDSGEAASLGDQLDAAERFLASRVDALAELAPECEITLRLGWSQEAPAEGAEETSIVIGPSLAGLLHRVGASVAIRVFTGPDA